jgi:hypothetical protein
MTKLFTFTPVFKSILLLVISFLSFKNDGLTQGSTGTYPTYTFFRNGLLNSGSQVGSILFRYRHNGQYLTSGASIRAVAAGSPSESFLAMNLSFSTGETALQERLRISSNGNVGVNTSTPNARLELEQFLTNENIDRPLLKVNGGLVDTPSSFTIFNQSNSRLQAILQGDFTINTGNLLVQDKNAIVANGRLLINTSEIIGDHKVLINGSAIATEFWVKSFLNWPDYVFSPSYQLMSLSEIEAFLKIHGHLPNMPSAIEIATNGFNLAEMQAKSFEKIEELTLHMIEMEKAHEQEIAQLNSTINHLIQRIEQLESKRECE